MTKFAFVGVWLMACATPGPDEPAPEQGTLVRASIGGTVSGGDVTLVIPPGSLSEDTVISIEPDVDAPAGEADGFTVLGRGYRFSPPGTQFSLAKPAVLTMPYDQVAVSQQSLDGRTVALAYFDEELGRYFSIGGEIDVATGFVTARVEHFTLYVAMAADLLPGNNAPTIALQSPVPSLLRADSPVYIRATVRDYDVGGSVAGAELHYKPAGAEVFLKLPMKPEATLDTFAALIPAAHIVAGPGAIDLEYFVTAVDNLGGTRTSATTSVDLTRTFAPGTLVMGPATPAIAAGFERTFTFQGRDVEANQLYAMVPENASAAGIGEISIGTAGVTFRARNVGSGAVTAGFGAHGTSQNVTVFNGALERVDILDQFGLPFDGTVVMREGKRLQLDALGFDAYDNQIQVNPTWAIDSQVGSINSTGELITLDGLGSGYAYAMIGTVVGRLPLYVQPRQFNTSAVLGNSTTAIPRLANRGGVPYVAFIDPGAVHVAHRGADGSWVDDGYPNAASFGSAIALAASDSRLQVAWYDDGGRLFSAHLEGSAWVQDGGNLVVDPNTTNYLGYQTHAIDVAVDGNTPYLASWESNAASASQVFVRRWNGSTWVLLGGSVGGPGYLVQEPSIAILGGVPHVAVVRLNVVDGGADVFVYRWNGTGWDQVGDALGVVPGQPAIAPVLRAIGSKLYVSLMEPAVPGRWFLWLKRLDGATWTSLFGTVNGYEVRDHDLASDGDIPYLVWTELQPDLSTLTRRVAHFNPATGNLGHVGLWNNTGNGDAQAVAITVAGGVTYVAARENPEPFPLRVFELQ